MPVLKKKVYLRGLTPDEAKELCLLVQAGEPQRRKFTGNQWLVGKLLTVALKAFGDARRIEQEQASAKPPKMGRPKGRPIEEEDL